MPVWIVPILLLAVLACPISMWVMGKVMGRKMSCAACDTGAQGKHSHKPEDLEARKATLEREIAEVAREIEAVRQVTGSTGSGVRRG